MSDRERHDLGRALTGLLVDKRDDMVRMGMLPPPGHGTGTSARILDLGTAQTDASPMPRAPTSRSRNTRDARSAAYAMFDPVRLGPPTDVLLRVSLRDPLAAFWDHGARDRLRRHPAVLELGSEMRCLKASLPGTKPSGLSLDEWDFVMRPGGVHRAPASEQPDLARLRGRAGPEQTRAVGMTYVLYRFALVEERHLRELLGGLSNEEASSRNVAIEEAEEDTFRAFLEDHLRVLLVLQQTPEMPGATTKRYRLETYLFTL